MAYWLNDESRSFLSKGYLREGQSAEERISYVASYAEEILGERGFGRKFEEDVHAGYVSMSSPIWANFGTTRGLPISCNNSYFSDRVDSILAKTAEIGQMTKQGAGTSAYMGDLRPRGAPVSAGGTSYGPVHFMGLVQATVSIISQSNIRRGACAVYLDVEHPDILEFLRCRDEGHFIQELSLGVCISDRWMEEMLAGDTAKREVWARIIRKRAETGYPYLFFSDTVNRNAPDVYRAKGMRIHSSNLCSEICLASSPDESFVCNLASLNALHFDEWKERGTAGRLVRFLDAVMTDYVAKIDALPDLSRRQMQAARHFAVNQRAIGVGILGYHSYLQSKMIPFESLSARIANKQIAKHIQSETLEASRDMAKTHGEPPLLEGYGRRHTTLMAVAPTTSSSFILGQVSPSIEPENSNYYTKDLQKGKFTHRNPYLTQLLGEKGKDDETTWRSILMSGGSVQHLGFLSQDEKDVFKTFGEINQAEIITQAADRQSFIDQSQSLNLVIHPSESPRDVSALMIDAWRQGVKTLYYQRSTNPAQEYARSLLSGCAVCEA